jgi:hypothetical protein
MCSPCFRTWFRTCTFFKNPKTWWTTYKNYEIPAFNKIAPSNSFSNRVRSIKLPFYNRTINDNVPETETNAQAPSNKTFQAQHEALRNTYQKHDSDLYPKVLFSTNDTNDASLGAYAKIKF